MASSACLSTAVAFATVAPSVAAPKAVRMEKKFFGKAVGMNASAKMVAKRNVAVYAGEIKQVIQPLNGDPFIGMLETPITSAPIVSDYLSKLPAYRTGVSPLLRGVEIGLAHGYLLFGPFTKTGPLRDTDAANLAGVMGAAGVVVLLTACLAIYGQATFQSEKQSLKTLTLSGRVIGDQLQTKDGWASFASGFAVGGVSGAVWAYILYTNLPFYL